MHNSSTIASIYLNNIHLFLWPAIINVLKEF